jgi:CHAD domain-containing protein
MSEGKWVTNLKASTPAAKAAGRVLKVRLEVVEKYLRPALKEPFKDPEPIHQLRVATRRAKAALDIFSSCLSRKIVKKVNKWLRTFRHAAGEARDWDVFLASLTAGKKKLTVRNRAGLDLLLGYAWDRRMAAQEQLVATAKEHRNAFRKWLGKTLAAIHKPASSQPQNLGKMARLQLADPFREIAKTGLRDLKNIQGLHRLRITGKRLRYAMEIFADCFAKPFREQLYPRVIQMQDILGAIHDNHIACERLESLRTQLQEIMPGDWPRFKPAIEWILKEHQAKIHQETQRFQEWWDHWQKSGAAALFKALLKKKS